MVEQASRESGVADDSTRGTDKRGFPMHYKGWTLPSPPSLESDDRDSPPSEAVAYPVFGSWKKDLDNEGVKSVKVFTEWKSSSSKKRRSKATVDGTPYKKAVDPPSDGTMSTVRRSRLRSLDLPIQSSKENTAPTFRPSFSQSRYFKQQKFRELTSYYKAKVKSETRQDDGIEELVAIKMELSDLKEWARTKRKKTKAKKVQFAHPLISSLNYRPKTDPEDIEKLYFQEEELLDWEVDRENTSSERFEVVFTGDSEQIAITSDNRSLSSYDSRMT